LTNQPYCTSQTNFGEWCFLRQPNDNIQNTENRLADLYNLQR
jgi:hypothetical protein